VGVDPKGDERRRIRIGKINFPHGLERVSSDFGRVRNNRMN
jgi:hypothetical protein